MSEPTKYTIRFTHPVHSCNMGSDLRTAPDSPRSRSGLIGRFFGVELLNSIILWLLS